MRIERTAQLFRPDPCRPSVVCDGGFWLARAYDRSHEYRVDAFHTIQEAYAKALEYAIANAELEPTA
jgi:hypothetical protein